MIKSIWHWFMIIMIVCGTSSAIVTIVCFLYLFAFYSHLTDNLFGLLG